MADYTVKRGDTYPPIRIALTDSNGAMDLTDATEVRLLLKSAGVTVVTGPVDIVSPATNGVISYTWEGDDLDNIGTYQGEVEITWDAGTTPPQIETVPNEGFFTIDVVQDLGGDA